MTLFGCIWFCIIVWDFVKKPINNTVFLTILFMTFQSTNVLYINGSGIGPGVLTSIYCILKIIIVQRFRIRKLEQPIAAFITSIFMLFIIYLSLVLMVNLCLTRRKRHLEPVLKHMLRYLVIFAPAFSCPHLRR